MYRIILQFNKAQEEMIKLYRDIYKKESIYASVYELIKCGLMYKDLQRKKDGLKPLTEIYTEWQRKQDKQIEEQKRQLLLNEKNELISRIVGTNKQ